MPIDSMVEGEVGITLFTGIAQDMKGNLVGAGKMLSDGLTKVKNSDGGQEKEASGEEKGGANIKGDSANNTDGDSLGDSLGDGVAP